MQALNATTSLRRRDVLVVGLAMSSLELGCTSPTVPRDDAWTARLSGPTIALLGEVHDNPELHRVRAAALRDALARGWRPAIVMEQFDLERQADIERARRERPDDAQHVIDQAGGGGWQWPDYRPVIALALANGLPLLAGNLSRAIASRLAREDYAVLGPERLAAWKLDAPPDDAWQSAQEHEIDLGHCGALPRRLWPALARGQFARDAAMAHLLAQHAARGAVLLAGNGHVRRDLGVPRWLTRQGAPSPLAVGFLERGATQSDDAGRYDAVVVTLPAARPDPCEAFRARPQPSAEPRSGVGRA